MKIYRDILKRPLDLCISVPLAIVLSPLIVVLVIWLHFANKGAGAVFSHERPGKHGKIFRIYKFKSMTDERDAEGNLLPDEQRITRVGKFLRSTSLDELPQLFNIIRGDISIVGPRPLRVEYLPLYSKEQARRHDVLPGVTGWAQVHGRNAISWEEKFKLDVWYVDHISFHTDMEILFLTALKILKRDGVNSYAGKVGPRARFNGHN